MNDIYKLAAFDPEGAYEPRQVEFIKLLVCGERTDYVWANVKPRFEKEVFAINQPIEKIILAPRHEGKSLLNINMPIHVYVCTVKSQELLLADEVSPNSIIILNWGLIYPQK